MSFSPLCANFLLGCDLLWYVNGGNLIDALSQFDQCCCAICVSSMSVCYRALCYCNLRCRCFYERQIAAAVATLKQHDAASAHACSMLALLHCGERFDENDVKLVKKAAEHPGALVELGACYYYGEGVLRNRRRALQCFEQASSAYAKFYLSVYYSEVMNNEEEERRHLVASAAAGYPPAVKALAVCHCDLEGRQQANFQTRKAMLEVSAKCGSAQSMVLIASALLDEQPTTAASVLPDELFVDSNVWLLRAMDAGALSEARHFTNFTSEIAQQRALEATARERAGLWCYQTCLLLFSLRSTPVLGDFYLLRLLLDLVLEQEEKKVISYGSGLVHYEYSPLQLTTAEERSRLLLAACVNRMVRLNRFTEFRRAGLMPYWVTFEYLQSLRYANSSDLYAFTVHANVAPPRRSNRLKSKK